MSGVRIPTFLILGGSGQDGGFEKTIYRARAIISRGLYTFLPHFQRPFMYYDLWPYVWLVFKSGF